MGRHRHFRRRSDTIGQTLSRRQKLLGLASGGAALACACALYLALPQAFAPLGDLLWDSYQRQSPRPANPDPAVVMIDIDENSLQRLGQWPWPRDMLGDLVDRLGQAGAAAIAFDMAFAEADRTSLAVLAPRLKARGTEVALPADPLARDNDLAFAAAIARNRVVLGHALAPDDSAPAPAPPKSGSAFTGSDPTRYLPDYGGALGNLPVLTDAALGLGSFSFVSDGDNIIRNLPVVAQAKGRIYPSLALEALRVAQGASGIVLRGSDTGLQAIKVGDVDFPADPSGRFWIHFSGMGHMAQIPAADLLAQSDPDPRISDRIAGRIALIGTSAIGLRDLVSTPLAAGVAGVILHAEVIDQILTGDTLQRPDWAAGAERVAMAGAGLILLLALLGGSAWAGLAAAAVLSGGAVIGAWAAFAKAGLLLDAVPLLWAVAATFTIALPVQLWLGNRDRRFVRAAFSRYLSPALVQRLSQDASHLRLGGETRDVTVLFSDIRGFTSLSERLGPEELTTLLNSLLTPLTEALLAEDATIDKYIGDAVMALWNAPLDIPDHPRKAARAALAMRDALAAINVRTGQSLQIGIGLHRGMACVGNLGSAQRFSYSAIGDSVNLAARVEGLTKQYGAAILVTQAIASEIPDHALLEADLVRVVGRQEAVRLYLLLGGPELAQDPQFQSLAQSHAHFITAWQSGDFTAAQIRLHGLRADAPADLHPFYALYHDRLVDAAAAPATDWDGIFTASRK